MILKKRPHLSAGRQPISRRTLWARARVRRVLSALLVGLAVWLGLSAATSDPVGALEQVVVASGDVAIGSELSRGDLDIVGLPPAAIPAQASSSPADWIGKRVVVPLRDGDALTSTHVSLPAMAQGQPNGQVIVHLPLTSSALAQAAAPGTRVDVMSTADGAVLAADVVVLDNGAGQNEREGPGLFVVVDPAQAAAITSHGGGSAATAIGGTAVTVALRP